MATDFYSQAGEDQFLIENLFHDRTEPGTYLEVGALDGVLYSNTKYFEDELGWTGVLIEPHPVLFENLVANRPNNFLSNALVSSIESPVEYTYFEQQNLAAVSGVSDTLTPHNIARFFENDEDYFRNARESGLRTMMTTPKSLDAIIAESGIEAFTFMSIDVEGHELSLLESFSFGVEVDVMLIETSPDNDAIQAMLAERGLHYRCPVAHNHLFTTDDYAVLPPT